MVATGRITATNLFFCTVPQIRLLQTIVRVYKLYLLTYLQFVGICPPQKVLLPVVPRTSLLFQNDRYCRFAQLTRKGLGGPFCDQKLSRVCITATNLFLYSTPDSVGHLCP